ncbi:MAG: hypothetical protein R3Y27_02435 [Clostridia bacterium]
MQALAEKVGKKTDYFLPEFHKIEQGQKSKFNLPAMFFSALYCIYRKNVKLGKILIVWIAISNAIILMLNWSLALMEGNQLLLSLNSIYGFVSVIIAIGISIYSGKNFNKTYHDQLYDEIVHPDNKNSKTIKILDVIFCICILLQFITPTYLYSTGEFEKGSLSGSVYTNESLDLAFTADSEFIMGDSADYALSVTEENADDVEFFFYTADRTIYGEFYTVAQVYKYVSADSLMSSMVLYNYTLTYDTANYYFLQAYTLGGKDFQAYQIVYTIGEVVYYDYYLISSINYGCLCFGLSDTDIETFIGLIDNFSTIDEAPAQDFSEDENQDSQLTKFETGVIDGSTYTNEAFGIEFNASSDLIVGNHDDYVSFYGETLTDTEFFAYDMAGTKYIEFYLDTYSTNITNEQYMQSLYYQYEEYYYNVAMTELETITIGDISFDGFYIYYEDSTYYYEDYYYIAKTDVGHIGLLLQGLDETYIDDLLSCFETSAIVL